MLKPICVKCKRFYRPKTNGYSFVEAMPAPGVVDPARGTLAEHHWVPYKLWSGDLWECIGCGSEVIVGTGRQPIAERFHPDFQEQVIAHRADKLQINDC